MPKRLLTRSIRASTVLIERALRGIERSVPLGASQASALLAHFRRRHGHASAPEQAEVDKGAAMAAEAAPQPAPEPAAEPAPMAAPEVAPEPAPAPEPEPGRTLVQRPIADLPEYSMLATPRLTLLRPFTILGDHALEHIEQRPIPETYVAELAGAAVFGACLAVIRDGELIRLSADTDLAKHPENYERHFREVEGGVQLRVNPQALPSGRLSAGVLVGNRFAKNYFHWLIECMPRVLMARDLGYTAPFVTNRIPQQAGEILELFGPAVYLDDHELVEFGQLAVPYAPSYCPDLPEEVPLASYDDALLPRLRQEIVTRLGSVPPGRASLLYIARRGGHGRNIINEPEIQARMVARGAQVIYPGEMTVAEQVSAFSGADVIVGPGGAGLANVLFCKPGATLVVLHRNRHVNPGYFRALTDAVGCELISVAGPPPDPDDPNPHALFSIDPLLLEEALDLAMARRS